MLPGCHPELTATQLSKIVPVAEAKPCDGGFDRSEPRWRTVMSWFLGGKRSNPPLGMADIRNPFGWTNMNSPNNPFGWNRRK